MAILTASQVRDRLPHGAPPIDGSDAVFDDTWLDAAIARHDATFTRYRGDLPDSATAVETVRPVGVSDRLMLRWPKATSITSITVDGSALASSNYHLDGGIVHGISYSWRPGTVVVVTYPHGFGAPEDLKDSCAWFVALKAQSERAGAATRSVRSSGPEFTAYVRADWAGGRPTGWDEVDDIWNSYPDLRLPGIG